jgi:UDP-2-acetamido-3-amino-2,3-dideoxy-glucuronate N-acetyltransferase
MSQQIATDVKMGNNVSVGEGVIIEHGVSIGNNVVLSENTVIRENATIGDNAIIGYQDRKTNGDTTSKPVTVLEEGAKVRSGCVIYCGSRIGKESMIGHNSVIRENTTIGHNTYIGSLVSIEGDTVVGDYVGIQTQCYITKYCSIGDYTFIAPCFAGANDPDMTHRRSGHGTNLEGFTTGKYVRIGIRAAALPGVHFGEGCIIGAGSLVTRDVPAYKVAYGVPARVVRDAPVDKVIDETRA